MTHTMRAVIIREPGGPGVLEIGQRARPEPGARQILIRVAAAGINRPDVFQRQGNYAPPPGASDVPGLEVAGTIESVGPEVTRFAPGDAVCALLPGGGYAEYCTVDATNALPLPNGLTMVEAAALPETFFTVWSNVFERGRLAEGEAFLVHGGSSGIGTVAIQLAAAFGARVLATAGSAGKCAACVRLGASKAINYREEDFVEAVKDATAGHGAELILDMVGGAYVARNYDAAAIDGRIVQIATLNGAEATTNFSTLMVKRLTHTGSTLRPRDTAVKARIADALERRVWPLLAARRITPVVDTVLPFEEVQTAHRRMDEGGHIGKIVLSFA